MVTRTSASIVLVEDHAILREGLRALIELEPDLKGLGEASSGAEGVRVAQSASPTLVITDLAMPGGSGLRTIDELRAACPNPRVLVLTAYCTDEYIGAALSAGADGYVLKNASRAELLQAIRSVIAGQKYFSEPVFARLVSGYLRRNDSATLACRRITERQRDMLNAPRPQALAVSADSEVDSIDALAEDPADWALRPALRRIHCMAGAMAGDNRVFSRSCAPVVAGGRFDTYSDRFRVTPARETYYEDVVAVAGPLPMSRRLGRRAAGAAESGALSHGAPWPNPTLAPVSL